MNIENEEELIEENSLFSMVSTRSINVDLKKKIEKEEVVQPSNMDPNKFRSY